MRLREGSSETSQKAQEFIAKKWTPVVSPETSSMDSGLSETALSNARKSDRKLSRLELKELLNFPIIPDPAPKEPVKNTFFEDLANDFIGELVYNDLHRQQAANNETTIYDAKHENLQRTKLSIKRRAIDRAKVSIIEKKMKPATTWTFNRLVNRIDTNIVEPIKPVYAEGFEDEVLDAARDPETVFFAIENHEGLGNGAESGLISKYITDLINTERPSEDPFKGFMLTISSTLGSGHQGFLWKELIRLADQKTTSKYNMPMRAFTRPKDKTKDNLDTDNAEYVELLKKIIKKDDARIADGTYTYIAGDMEAGRRIKRNFPANLNPFGRHINGQQELHCEGFNTLARLAELRYHKRVVIIPVGSFGAPDVFDPEHHSWPTPKAIIQLLNPKPKSLISVKVGLPIPYDNLVLKARQLKPGGEITSKDMDTQFGYLLAGLLPEEGQGFYKINS